nr:3-hydroxyacyl-CoA dehydrogenase [Paracidobacterium acidisoli]
MVGCGLVGGSWSLVFARAGFSVTLYDPSPASIDIALQFVKKSSAALAEMDLLRGQKPEDIAARLKTAGSLEEAVHDADYVQESSPERLPIKQALYKEMAPLIKPDAMIGSSTSGLPPSSFTEDVPNRERCMVVHPLNPPHLIPLVELVPAPWTLPSIVDTAEALMRQLGQVPIRLNREVTGFIVNRLQGAILNEAFRLVEDGVCSAADIDAAMTEGLGLRWFFIGPFENIDLNAQGGLADYCAKLAPMNYAIAKEQVDPRKWTDVLLADVHDQMRQRTPMEQLDKRKAWRDRCLALFIRMKSNILKENS